MPLRDSEAIILKTYPMGEGDRLVSFLSRGMGRVRGVARGARKTKSRFGSTLEPLSHVRIWFFERETRELVSLNQTELIESFLGAFSDYASGVALALLTEITELVLPDREPSDPAFRLLLLSARAIKKTGAVALPIAYFSLWTLRLGGWLPALARCAHCGLDLRGLEAYSAPARPSLVCARCRLPGMRMLSAPALAVAQSMIGARLEELMMSAKDTKEKLPKGAMHELTEYLLDIIEQQIERKLVSRQMLEPLA